MLSYLVMLLSEHKRTSFHKNRFSTSTNLIRIGHLKQIHRGYHGLRQLLPHGEATRDVGEDQLSIVDVAEDGTMSGE